LKFARQSSTWQKGGVAFIKDQISICNECMIDSNSKINNNNNNNDSDNDNEKEKAINNDNNNIDQDNTTSLSTKINNEIISISKTSTATTTTTTTVTKSSNKINSVVESVEEMCECCVKTRARRYLITRQQFYDVVSQELGLDPGPDYDLTEVLRNKSSIVKDCGWYNQLLLLDVIDKVPCLTFTCENFDELVNNCM
jgi:hypothetical protein